MDASLPTGKELRPLNAEGMNAGQIIGTMHGQQVIGLDIAKHVFQLHSADMATVSGNKTDAADTRAIWTAVQPPGVKFVGIETAAQQATLTLHRQRELLMKMRTKQTNALRGLLTATAAIATMGDARAFKSGREFCAWLGLVSKQTGTDGKVRLGGISQARRHLGCRFRGTPQTIQAQRSSTSKAACRGLD